MLKKPLAAALTAVLLASIPLSARAAYTEAADWPLGQALPHFGAPAARLDGMDLTGRPFAEQLAAACLQGIVNRAQPRLFIVVEPDPWAADLGLQVDMLPAWQDAVAKYRAELQGLVVWNPAIKETANVATTVAGVTNCLAVSPELAAVFSAAPYNLPIVKDLRDESAVTDKLSAYRWMHENYWAQCTKRTICGLVPDGHTQLRDFAVAVKAAVLWLDAGVPEERAVLELFFRDSAPIDTYYTGWWPDEPQGVAFASTYGVMTIAADFYLNYTVYSGMSRQIAVPPIPAKPILENDKIYVSLLISDGDNIQYCQHFMRGDRIWADPARGRVPIGYTFAPVLLDAGPQLLNYYHATSAENDVLISGPSGVGYSTAAHWPNKAFAQKYGALSNSYFERTGFNFITVWSNMTAQRANWYAGAFPSLLGMTVQFVELSDLEPKVRFTNTDVPVVWLGSDNPKSKGSMSYDEGTSNMKERLSAAAALHYNRPQFYIGQASAWATTVSDLARLAEELDAEFPGRFVFVRPDHFMLLVNEAYGRPFWASLQKTAQASCAAPGHEAALAFDGTFSNGWQAAEPGEASLTVDLGASFRLERYVLKNAETNYADSSLNTKAWRLQASEDCANWKEIDAVSGNGAAIAYRSLKGQRARYVRLLVKDPGADGYARVQELEIYGAAQNQYRAYGFFYSIWNSFTGCFFNLFDGVKRLLGFV